MSLILNNLPDKTILVNTIKLAALHFHNSDFHKIIWQNFIRTNQIHSSCWYLGFRNGLTVTSWKTAEWVKKRLIFGPNVAVFIPEACFRFCQHLSISGVLIGCFLLNPPVIGQFDELLVLSVLCLRQGLHLARPSHPGLSTILLTCLTL